MEEKRIVKKILEVTASGSDSAQKAARPGFSRGFVLTPPPGRA